MNYDKINIDPVAKPRMTRRDKWLKINIDPVAKPRMTRRDKWQKRPCVQKYRNYCDKLRIATKNSKINWGSKIGISFCMPMPKSWSEKKKIDMCFQYHRQTPDIDNLLKGVMDALLKNDSHVCDTQVFKRWGHDGCIIISWEKDV